MNCFLFFLRTKLERKQIQFNEILTCTINYICIQYYINDEY